MSTDLQRFEPLKAEIALLVSPVMSVTVAGFQDSQNAIDAAKTLKAMSKRLDEMRRAETDPLNERVKAINAYVKQLSAPLDAADAHLRNELTKFAAEQEKIVQEQRRIAEAEAAKQRAELLAKQEEERLAAASGSDLFGSDDAESAEQLAVKQAEERQILAAQVVQKNYDINQFQLKNTRKTAKIRVLDILKVPRDFLIIEVNEKAAIAAMKAGVKIPGLELYEEIGIAIGSKTRATQAALTKETLWD